MKVKVAIAGCRGRMGKMLVESALNSEHAQLSAALEHSGSDVLGQDAGAFLSVQTGIEITSDIEIAFQASDCLIDFTRPEGTLAHLAVAQRLRKAMVIGTTGLTAAHKDQIAVAAKEIPIVLAPNMAVGVNAVFKLLDIAAKILSSGYDIEIVEAHHRHKVDAPSGTALRMGEIVAQALGRDLRDCAVYGREGVTGERDEQTIGFATVRGGDIVGDHTVMFAGLGERVEVTHKASSRMPYAIGALRAAHFLADKKNGLFDMQDVLGLKML